MYSVYLPNRRVMYILNKVLTAENGSKQRNSLYSYVLITFKVEQWFSVKLFFQQSNDYFDSLTITPKPFKQ